MEQQEGYEVHGKIYLVCKLKESLYGLRQSPQKWYKKVDACMRSQDYNKC